MDALRRIISVDVKTVGAPCAASPQEAPIDKDRLGAVSRMPLLVQLSVHYENNSEEIEQATMAFLSLVGETSLETAWGHLFGELQLVPFITYSDLSEPRDFLRGEADGSQVSGGEALSMASSPDHLLLTTSTPSFVFGVPTLWAEQHLRPIGKDTASLTPPSDSMQRPSFLSVVSGSDGLMEMGLDEGEQSWIQAGPRRPRQSRRHRPGGRTVVIQPTTEPQVVPCSDTGSVQPRAIHSDYEFLFSFPEIDPELFEATDAALVFVLLLPISESSDQTVSVLRSLLARSIGFHSIGAATAGLVLGSCVIPVYFTEALACHSTTSPLSNDRLVLNFSLTNVTAKPLQLSSAAFDVHSSRVMGDPHHGATASAAKERDGTLWAEQRPGANLASMRTIDLLTKFVTVTPIVVGEDRPPVVLHPGETYSFQFIIEVVPQLCHLLNPQSLEYVYQRYYTVDPLASPDVATEPPRPPKKSCTPPSSVTAEPNAGAAVAVKDCYGCAVTAAEIRTLLSLSYVSHMFVYYDVMSDTAGGVNVEPVLPSGLHLRYAAPWSFGA